MGQFNLLLIEDDDDHAELIDFAVSKSGKANIMHRCADGDEAAQYLKKIVEDPSLRPDLFLMDVNIPRKSGLEVLREIKQIQELANIPVVIFTTSNSAHDKQCAYRYHVNSYLVKSADFEEFNRTIDEMIKYWSAINRN